MTKITINHKTERFALILTTDEKLALQRLAQFERISAAAVVRRLIWREAVHLGLLKTQYAEVE